VVRRERFDDLDEALAAMRSAAEEVGDEGPLRPVKVFREYQPGDRVAARLEISTGGMLRRGRDAGLDVMGDGRLVPYAGATRRRTLELEPDESPFDAVRRELA
jgi:hypothetical protein